MANMVTPPDPPSPMAQSFSYNMFLNAISSGAIDAVRQHIAHEPEVATTFGWHRQTALHRACMVGNPTIVKMLLDAGADPNAANNFDETPVHYACKRGLPHVLKSLLDKGGDVTLVDKMGKGVIHHAAEAGSVHLLHMLITLCPNLTFKCQDYNYATPLHLSIKAGKLETFKYLTKTGRSDLKCPDKDGNWPIHLSAQEGYGHMTWSQLCILGLSALHVPNKHSATPYELANMHDTSRHAELVSELEWQTGRSDRSDCMLRARMIWFYYLLLPILLYGAAIVVTRCLPGYHGFVFFPAVFYIIHTVRVSFHRLDHISRWPQPIHAGAFVAGMVHTGLFFILVIFPTLPQYSGLKLVSIFFIVVVGSLYVKLMTTDPGRVTSSAWDEVTGKSLTIMDVCTPDNWTTFCPVDEIVQSSTTKHCKLCDGCMRGMDHHCLFLLRCVAGANHALFVWFIILCLAAMVLFLYSSALYLSQAYARLPWFPAFLEILSTDSWVLTLFLLNCVSVFWGSTLLLYQYNVISNGHTQFFRPQPSDGRLSCGQKMTNVALFLLGRPLPHSVSHGGGKEVEVPGGGVHVV